MNTTAPEVLLVVGTYVKHTNKNKPTKTKLRNVSLITQDLFSIARYNRQMAIDY